MAKILINLTQCEITEENDLVFLSKLDKELSFKLVGVEHTPAFKFGRWNGVTHLLTKKLGFPIGLLHRVKSFYHSLNRPVEIVDKRPPKSEIKSIEILSTLKAQSKVPFQHQIDVLEVVKNNDIGIIRVATGGGKTLCSALIAAYFGKATNIYVIGTDLLHQFHKFVQSVFKEPIGKIGDGHCEIHRINVVSVWTVGQALGLKKNEIILDENDEEIKLDDSKIDDIKKCLLKSKVHIFDECHLAACKTIQTICKSINPEHIYGMSASPWRDTGDEMLVEAVLGGVIIDVSASLLIERDILVKPIIKFIKTPPSTVKLEKNYQTVYSEYIVNNNTRNNLVIQNALSLIGKGYKVLILFSTVAHGKILYKELIKYIPCELLSGKDSADVRDEAKRKIESGEINCILASKIFDIGVDIPILSGLVLAGGGKSSVRCLQRIGRSIRRYPGKKIAAIIDFYDQAYYVKEHSLRRRQIYELEPAFEIRWPK